MFREARIEAMRRFFGNTLVVLAVLGLAGPAFAGQQGGNLAVKLLELELGGLDHFLLCDDDGSGECDPAEALEQTISGSGKGKNACKISLAGAELVALTSAAGDPGIDANKGAIGDTDNQGTGCGQLEENDVLHIDYLGLGVVESRVQFEAKQDAAWEIRFTLDSVEVGKRYVLSGNAVPPEGFPTLSATCPGPGCPDLLLCNYGTPDGNPDSGENDDCLLYLSQDNDGNPNPEPFHTRQSYLVRNSGALSLKAGSEFTSTPPDENRSWWRVVEYDGTLACGEPFSCAGNPDCISNDVSGNRTEDETGDLCSDLIPYELKYDGREVTFNFLDLNNNEPGIHLEVQWLSEPTGRDPLASAGKQFPLDPTILSYDPAGVSCDPGTCSNDGSPCDSNGDCAAGNTCVLPVTKSCVPLTWCVGTPIRRCSNDPGLACEEDVDCGGADDTCRFADLSAPAPLGFPDLVTETEDLEYGCVCEEDVRYLGPGLCDAASGDLAGSSCDEDADCGTNGGSCQLFGRCDADSGAKAGESCTSGADCVDGEDEGACVSGDELSVEQCLFFKGDAALSRGGRKTF